MQMAKILILGAGVMGTALAVPAADNGHEVVVAGTPLDDAVIDRLKVPGGVHPKLDHPLAESVIALHDAELTSGHMAAADLVIIGVSSPGISWAVKRLNETLLVPRPVAFVTKGLDRQDGRIVSYAETVPGQVGTISAFIGIGGPCIARELANRYPTTSVYASRDPKAAEFARDLMRTSYYRLDVTGDATGVECCAALKNFFAIGVSAMQTRYPDTLRPDGQSKNPTAAAFTQASVEMAALCQMIGGRRETAFDLAGIGDLHVTVGGGRNSRLGHGLGRDLSVRDIMTGELAGETVEGIDTARVLVDLLKALPETRRNFPLAWAIVDAVVGEDRLSFDFGALFS
jgi:glycerol-3-phosphate dehydrogenase (NAD(P)+)